MTSWIRKSGKKSRTLIGRRPARPGRPGARISVARRLASQRGSFLVRRNGTALSAMAGYHTAGGVGAAGESAMQTVLRVKDLLASFGKINSRSRIGKTFLGPISCLVSALAPYADLQRS